jgi:radical SAM protein with 4Fe4S-binding SPASM domain
LDSAQVSLEGVTAKIHDKIVNSKGAFKKSIAGFESLKNAGILTHTNTTITKTNLDECFLFPQFVREVLGNDRFSMNLIIPTGSAAINDKLTVRYSETGKHLKKIISESRKNNVEFMWYSPVPMCLFNSIPHGLGNKGCSACDGLISVAPNGDVLPCASYDESVGNLLKQDFKTIWQSINAVKFRTKSLAHDICKKCEDFHICNGACPLYWRVIGFDELDKLVL